MGALALLLVGIFPTAPTTAPALSFSGVWVADLTRCDFGQPAANLPQRLVLDVREGPGTLEVLELRTDAAGSRLVEHRFLLQPTGRPLGRDQGTATSAGRMTVLRFAGQFECWRMSQGDAELLVDRQMKITGRGGLQRLVFRRATTSAGPMSSFGDSAHQHK
jgi:hypothetical protein